MGCCSSKGSQAPINENPNSSSSGGSAKKTKEDKIELAFKAKRANVFTKGVDLQREAFVKKELAKTPSQTKTIMAAISQNYIFASMNKEDLQQVVSAMDILDVSAGENIITQGQNGNYFYVVSSGKFTVIVNGKPVASLSDGNSFGELALLYNSPRQATIRADSHSVVFSLDRETYKYIVAQSSSNRDIEIKQALAKVPLLADLTEEQREKLSDTVEIFPYNAGDVIIKKGAEGNVFYMVKEGTVSVTEMGAQFSDHTLTAGDYFGERALLTGEPRAATITALTPVKVMALDRLSFDALLGPLRDVLDHNMNLRILRSVKLFEKLSEWERKKLAASFHLDRFAAGVAIIRQGDPGKSFYIVKEGTARVTVDGKEVSLLKAGTYFGEMALLDDEARKATVSAATDCECFVLDRETFTRLLGSLQHILDRETTQRLEELRGGLRDNDAAAPMLSLSLTDLSQIALLGSGTFGRVTLVQDKKSKEVYALKAMWKSEIVAQKQQVNVLNEKNVMISSNHTFILRLYQTFRDAKRLYMLLEFVQGGELFSVLHTNTSDGVPDTHANFYGAVVTCALAYLHSKDIAYRDMKPENCLIDRFGYPKLVDFGFAKVITGKSYTLCGTPEYLAPELVLARGHTKAVDCWALGVLIYEMIAGYSPFSDAQGNDQVVVCKNIVNGRLVFPKQFNADCKDLVKRLLSREVSTRLGNLKGGVEDVKTHKWFTSMDWDALLQRQIKAPWLPQVSSATDVSHFDPYGVDDHLSEDSHAVDHGNWDKDF